MAKSGLGFDYTNTVKSSENKDGKLMQNGWSVPQLPPPEQGRPRCRGELAWAGGSGALEAAAGRGLQVGEQTRRGGRGRAEGAVAAVSDGA